MTRQGAAARLIVDVPGIGTTIQDAGRIGWQRFGVPVSGALDRIALAAANIIVGNAPGAAAIECLYSGCTLTLTEAPALVAASGHGATLEITAPGVSEPRRVRALESALIPAGSRITLRPGKASISAYLAIAGGIATEPVLGSRSTYSRAALGGIDGRRLRQGDPLPLAPTADQQRRAMRLPNVDLAPRDRIRVVLGPQDTSFTQRAIETLTTASFTVTAASDRMGLRLDGPRLEHTGGADILSDGIPPGAIQVPGSGLPIIMLADRQTTGGYTKIATVISADLPALGRIGSGAKLNFDIVDVKAAEMAARALAADIASWPQTLVPVRPGDAEIARALFEQNLVSGVVDAVDQVEATSRTL